MRLVFDSLVPWLGYTGSCTRIFAYSTQVIRLLWALCAPFLIQGTMNESNSWSCNMDPCLLVARQRCDLYIYFFSTHLISGTGFGFVVWPLDHLWKGDYWLLEILSLTGERQQRIWFATLFCLSILSSNQESWEENSSLI